MLERWDKGAVDGLSPCRMDVLLETFRLVDVAEPSWAPEGLSGCFPRDGTPRFVLEIGTTRLMPWFSELLRVRTGLFLVATKLVLCVAGFIPAGRVLEVGRFLDDGLDKGSCSVFAFEEESSFLLAA